VSSTLSEPSVRPAREADLHQTAVLHEQFLPGGFFARLGRRFLRRYHQAFAASPQADVLVVRDGGSPAGMLVGTYDNAAHYRWVTRRRGRLLALVGLLSLLVRPRLAWEFLRTRVRRYARAALRYLRRRVASTADGAEGASDQVAVLTHVAVSPQARGAGVGGALVEAFVERAQHAGAREVRLITPSQGPGPSFYRSLGWHRLGGRRAADGTVVDEFVLPLSE
jgi:ribosomal protein S18 acetylase RimI-like enzyme